MPEASERRECNFTGFLPQHVTQFVGWFVTFHIHMGRWGLPFTLVLHLSSSEKRFEGGSGLSRGGSTYRCQDRVPERPWADDLKRSLPTSTVLWFCHFTPSLWMCIWLWRFSRTHTISRTVSYTAICGELNTDICLHLTAQAWKKAINSHQGIKMGT